MVPHSQLDSILLLGGKLRDAIVSFPLVVICWEMFHSRFDPLGADPCIGSDRIVLSRFSVVELDS